MELFSGKKQCCGCMACVDVCPQNAIAIEIDAEGFSYPKIRRKLCINCKRCKNVCPMFGRLLGKQPYRYFAVQEKKRALRETSTSGAVFPVLAEAVLGQRGAVYGAGFDDSMCLEHQRVAGFDELDRITRSKYVQSKTAGIFRRVQQDLVEGRQVLFVGTPCQAEALRRFLGKEYTNLLLADLICYGVPSPGIWARYTAYLERRHSGKLTEFQFRDKRGRDNGHTVSYRIDDTEYTEKYDSNLYTALYAANCMLRPSCHVCPFTTVERNTDITIGDFWGIEKTAPEMDDGMGTSVVMVRSEQGIKIWESVRDQFYYIECGQKEVLQPRLVSPTLPSSKRHRFLVLHCTFPFGVFVQIKKIREAVRWKKTGLMRKRVLTK